ncbi:hypothetical protein M3Y99_01480000 [Aphelenchoides fujianensis]|nr:hypothetical protein M3Y99_01480000 [Aphelenchoides fujianensis]
MIARVALVCLGLALAASAAVPLTPKLAGFHQHWFPNMAPDDFFLTSERSINPRKLAAGPVNGCYKLQFSSCQSQLVSDLGLDPAVLKNATLFAQGIAAYYTKTGNPSFSCFFYSSPILQDVTTGLLPLCKAQNTFRECISVWYSPCTDALQLYKMNGGTIQDAFTLAGVYDDLEFDCGGGLIDGLLNWPLHLPTPQCLTLVYKSLGKDCINNDVSWWVCEGAMRRTRLDGYCPKNSCTTIFPKPTMKPPTQSPSLADPRRELVDHINAGGLFSESHLNYFRHVGEMPVRPQRHQ